MTAPQDANMVAQNKITDVLVPHLESITPGGGTNMNETDY